MSILDHPRHGHARDLRFSLFLAAASSQAGQYTNSQVSIYTLIGTVRQLAQTRRDMRSPY